MDKLIQTIFQNLYTSVFLFVSKNKATKSKNVLNDKAMKSNKRENMSGHERDRIDVVKERA